MRICIGHHQRQCRRAFIESNGKPVSTAVLMRECYPGRAELERWRWAVVGRAARRWGRSIRYGWWAPNAELEALIKGEM
jgi:hypothetical protein